MNVGIMFLQMLILDGALVLILLLSTRKGAIGAVHMYPQEVQKKVIELGMTTKEKIEKRGKRLKLVGSAAYFTILLLTVFVWNGARDFRDVFVQSLILLEQLNLFDCLIIDELWVKHSKYWIIPGTENLVKTYIPVTQQIKKRIAVAVLYGIVSFIIAGIASLLF